jgi:uncharacterized protein
VATRLQWVTIRLVILATSASLLDRLRAELSDCPEILEAYLFGSVAREEAQPHSDIDVAVFVAPSALDRAGFGYDAELGAKLQQALARSDVDVVVLNHAGPVLYHRVLTYLERAAGA